MHKPRPLSAAQREFWNQLRDYIHQNEAWVTSEPHVPLIRFEWLPLSSLPDLMRNRGYDVVGAGCAKGFRLQPKPSSKREKQCRRAAARFPFTALGALYARTFTKWSSRFREM
jgi:hypothetical protein